MIRIGLDRNTGEIKAVKKGTGHSTSYTDGSGQVSSVTGTPLRTEVYGPNYTLYIVATKNGIDRPEHNRKFI